MSSSTAGKLARIPCGRRAKWIVLVFWLLVIFMAAPLAGKLNGAEKNDTAAWLPGNAESTKVVDLQKKFQPEQTLPAVIVYERQSGITAADQHQVAGEAAKFGAVAKVESTGIRGPIPAHDGKALQVLVPITMKGADGWNGVANAVDKIRAITGSGSGGLTVHITGPGGTAADSGSAFKGIDGTLLYTTLAVVIVMLLLTYRSPVLWLLPVMSAGAALSTAQGAVYLLAKAGLTVNAQSAGILTVLVFGAGTDYALLLVARYREELRRHADRHEAMAFALHRAGPAIAASAATVAVGMLCLLVAEMNSTKGLGPVSAVGIGVGLLAMLTLLPALLVILGRWIFWPVRPRFGTPEPTASGMWAKVGAGIARRPRVVWTVTAVVLGIVALGLLDLKANGLSNAQSFIDKPDSVVGEQVLAEHFPAGQGQPVVVIGPAAKASSLHGGFAATSGIAAVTPPVTKSGYVYLEGTLTAAPDSAAANATVDRVRAVVHRIDGSTKVGGATAINMDVARAARHDRNLIIPLILLAVFVILGLLLRALIAPLVLIATVVLSFATSLGLSTLVFNHLFHFGGADTSFPLFVFVFLVALGIDYNIFLMTRVREEALQHGTRRGALIGLAATGGVITSAGMVLAGTFAALATLPLVAFAEIGFAVAVGVLIDTIVVRSVLVTALNLDIGRRMWWPSALAYRRDVVVPDGTGERETPESALAH